MKKLCAVSVALLGVAAIVFAGTAAQADTLSISQTGTVLGITYSAGAGGEFTIKPIDGPLVGVESNYSSLTKNIKNAPSFQSFCLETRETMSSGEYVFNTKAIEGGVGPGGDPISPETAYLYTQFARGVLSSYDYSNTGVGRSVSAAELQRAIWELEGETIGSGQLPATTGQAATWKAEATAAAWATIRNVRVLNITDASGSIKQDMLVLVPTPAAALAGLPLLGLLFAGHVVRRRLRRA